MRAVGLVPARGGSKGIPKKNLVEVAGKPLLVWTLEAARASRTLSRLVVSTDDDAIAAVAEANAAEVLRRPAELARDETPMLDVVLHAFQELAEADVLVVLQPTSPLRRAEHIDGAVELFEQSGADGVVSVVRTPHRFLPESQVEIEDGRAIPAAPSTATRRQDKRELYARNGPAVLVVRREGLEARGLYGGDLRAYVMQQRESLDIDEPADLELAELLLGANR